METATRLHIVRIGRANETIASERMPLNQDHDTRRFVLSRLKEKGTR